MRRALLAVPLLLVLAGCGSSEQAQTVTALPRPAPLPAKASAACKASQLRPDWQGRQPRGFLQAAGGTMIGGLALRNVGAEPCSLGPGLRIRLEPALVLQTTPPPAPATGGAATAAWLGSLAANREALVSIQWANWCVKHRRPARLRIVLPQGGGSLTVAAARGVPKCFEISAPTTVSATPAPVLGRLVPTTAAGPRIPLVAQILPPAEAEQDSALRARPGGVLRYRVELTSSADDPLKLPTCPLLAQQLSGAAPDVRVLDCGALRGLEHDHSAIYDMALKVPALTAPGSHSLIWMLEPYTTQLPSATAPVTVTTG